eukprot:COSAG02_NODE_9249_length_2278_cov_1.292795_1_plen_202_part_10
MKIYQKKLLGQVPRHSDARYPSAASAASQTHPPQAQPLYLLRLALIIMEPCVETINDENFCTVHCPRIVQCRMCKFCFRRLAGAAGAEPPERRGRLSIRFEIDPIATVGILLPDSTCIRRGSPHSRVRTFVSCSWQQLTSLHHFVPSWAAGPGQWTARTHMRATRATRRLSQRSRPQSVPRGVERRPAAVGHATSSGRRPPP